MFLKERLGSNGNNGREVMVKGFPIRVKEIKFADLKTLGLTTDILMLFDIHAGSKWGRMEWAAMIAQYIPSRLLLLGGDITDDLHLGNRLTSDDWINMWTIKETGSFYSREISSLPGNHDPKEDPIVLAALGARVIPSPFYTEYNGVKIAVIHGHEYTQEAVPTGMELEVAAITGRLAIAFNAKKLHEDIGGRLFRMGTKVKNSLKNGRSPDADIIVYGHVHRIDVDTRGSKALVNAGCCNHNDMNFATLDSTGLTVYKVKLGK